MQVRAPYFDVFQVLKAVYQDVESDMVWELQNVGWKGARSPDFLRVPACVTRLN